MIDCLGIHSSIASSSESTAAYRNSCIGNIALLIAANAAFTFAGKLKSS
jgi:hypothetical protein